MRFPKTATALVLIGAVGLASAAYGIGSATGGGSATADPDTPKRERGFHIVPPPGSDDLADRLGVDADKLADAMRDFHEQEAGERRDELADALARGLGVPADEVRQALDEVKDAIEPPRPRPGMPPRLHHRGHPLRELARALDVTRAELREALRELREGAQSGLKEHQEELAEFLADRFGLDAGEVEEALADMPRPAFRVGACGPDGPGGPDGPRFGRGVPDPPPFP